MPIPVSLCKSYVCFVVGDISLWGVPRHDKTHNGECHHLAHVSHVVVAYNVTPHNKSEGLKDKLNAVLADFKFSRSTSLIASNPSYGCCHQMPPPVFPQIELEDITGPQKNSAVTVEFEVKQGNVVCSGRIDLLSHFAKQFYMSLFKESFSCNVYRLHR